MLIFGTFVSRSAYQEIATACGLAMTELNDTCQRLGYRSHSSQKIGVEIKKLWI